MKTRFPHHYEVSECGENDNNTEMKIIEEHNADLSGRGDGNLWERTTGWMDCSMAFWCSLSRIYYKTFVSKSYEVLSYEKVTQTKRKESIIISKRTKRKFDLTYFRFGSKNTNKGTMEGAAIVPRSGTQWNITFKRSRAWSFCIKTRAANVKGNASKVFNPN